MRYRAAKGSPSRVRVSLTARAHPRDNTSSFHLYYSMSSVMNTRISLNPLNQAAILFCSRHASCIMHPGRLTASAHTLCAGDLRSYLTYEHFLRGSSPYCPGTGNITPDARAGRRATARYAQRRRLGAASPVSVPTSPIPWRTPAHLRCGRTLLLRNLQASLLSHPALPRRAQLIVVSGCVTVQASSASAGPSRRAHIASVPRLFTSGLSNAKVHRTAEEEGPV